MRRLAVPRPSRRVCNKAAHVHQKVVFHCMCVLAYCLLRPTHCYVWLIAVSDEIRFDFDCKVPIGTIIFLNFLCLVRLPLGANSCTPRSVL